MYNDKWNFSDYLGNTLMSLQGIKAKAFDFTPTTIPGEMSEIVFVGEGLYWGCKRVHETNTPIYVYDSDVAQAFPNFPDYTAALNNMVDSISPYHQPRESMSQPVKVESGLVLLVPAILIEGNFHVIVWYED